MTERAGRWGLRAFAFLGAVVIWWLVSVEKRDRISEKVIDASVSYNTPRGLILLDPIQSVKVRLRGPERQVRALSPFELDVVVDVAAEDTGSVAVQLSAENVLTPEEVEVVSIEPAVIDLRLDRDETAMVPVFVPLIGEPAGGAVPGQLRVTPNQARVRGPATLLASLTSISTSPISLDGHALDFVQTVSVVSTDPLVRVVDPPFVTVQVPMASPEALSGEAEGAAEANPRAP